MSVESGSIEDCIRRNKQLESELLREQLQSSRISNSRRNLLASSRSFLIELTDDLKVRKHQGAVAVLGPVSRGQHIRDVFKTDEALEYFSGFIRLHGIMLAAADGVDPASWIPAYPLPSDLPAGLTAWAELPRSGWKKNPEEVESVDDGEMESYLMSQREIIRETDDFRIEYDAISRAKEPCDLSVVTGVAVPEGTDDVEGYRPDRDGYCFAVGAVRNQALMIQRSGEALAEVPGLPVEPGREYHFRMEKLGGVLTLSIDGRELCRGVDFLPLRGRGFIGFYSCAEGQTFRNLRVWTRASCLPQEALDLISRLRAQKLRYPGPPALYLEPTCLFNRRFLIKDVTDIVEQREKLKESQILAEKMDTLLHLASGAAHELNQPLTLLTGYLDLILKHPPRHAAVPVSQEELQTLKEATGSIAGIVAKMGSLHRYKTRPYIDDRHILDIDGSASSNR